MKKEINDDNQFVISLKEKYDKEILKKSEVAEYLDVSLGTVSNLLTSGNLNHLKLGRGPKASVRISIYDVAELLENSRVTK
jgi:excisionase family DNA binding protein